MDSVNKIDSLIRQILHNLPEELARSKADFEKNLRASLQGAFTRMELVTRDEFDVQAELLSRTRALVDELQQRIATMEQSLKDKS